jgi:hypothetical protein
VPPGATTNIATTAQGPTALASTGTTTRKPLPKIEASGVLIAGTIRRSPSVRPPRCTEVSVMISGFPYRHIQVFGSPSIRVSRSLRAAVTTRAGRFFAGAL